MTNRILSLELSLPNSAAALTDSKNSITGMLLLSPLHGSTKFATHIFLVAVGAIAIVINQL
jgi:hypothetical protein